MGKYFGIAGKRIGKIGNEKYFIRGGENVVQESVKYVPVNSSWLKKKEFEEYVKSLVNVSLDGVDVVDKLPEEFKNNTIYFVKKDSKENLSTYDTYVYEEDVLKTVQFSESQQFKRSYSFNVIMKATGYKQQSVQVTVVEDILEGNKYEYTLTGMSAIFDGTMAFVQAGNIYKSANNFLITFFSSSVKEAVYKAFVDKIMVSVSYSGECWCGINKSYNPEGVFASFITYSHSNITQNLSFFVQIHSNIISTKKLF